MNGVAHNAYTSNDTSEWHVHSYNLGGEARQQGVSISNNPCRQIFENKAWRAGWVNMDKIIRQS
ncbi:MAG: hypothetical protein QM500_12230 [Methylococcales bacterium]